MTYQLRDYQIDSANIAVRELRANKGRPFILVLATGAGKSLVIADICHQLDAPTLILQPSKELLEQNYEKMLAYGISDVKIYSASMGKKEIGQYVMATIGSIYRKPEQFKMFKNIIIDEADVVSPTSMEGMYQSFFKAIDCKNIVGLTATPYRMHVEYEREGFNLYAINKLKLVTNIGRKPFWSGGIIYKIETQELIDRKYLSPIKYKSDSDDLHQLVLNKNGTEYSEASVEAWIGTKVDKIADYVEWVDKHCNRNLVFCTSVLQSTRLQQALESKGIRCGLVTAETPKNVRESLVADFRSGKLRHMINCSVFLAGFDVPELDCVIFAKPTLSPRIWYQAVGRGLRIDPANKDKVLRVFDLAGSLNKIGAVETIRLYGDHPNSALFSSIGRLDERKGYRFLIKKKVGHASNR